MVPEVPYKCERQKVRKIEESNAVLTKPNRGYSPGGAILLLLIS
jgi:hypothetical protein